MTQKSIIVSCFVWMISLVSSAQTICVPVERYSLEQGLNQSMVTFTFADSAGLRWVGTGGGLHYFDGRSFQAFIHKEDVPNSLPDNTPRNMSAIDGNRYYVNTAGSIAIFNRADGTFETFCTPRLSEPVFLGPQTKEPLYFWTRDEGFFRMENGKKENITLLWKSGATPKDFIPRQSIKNNDVLLICGNKGIIEMDLRKEKNGYPSKWISLPEQFHLIAKDPKGKTWLAANGKTYLYQGNGKLQAVYENGTGRPTAFLIDSKGNHWIADESAQQLFQFRDNKRFTVRLTVREGRFTDTLKTRIGFLDEDESGNIWIGTDGQGLLLYTAENFRFQMSKIGFVRSITTRKNEVWAGTYKNGLWKLSPDLNQKRKVVQKNIPENADVLALFTDRFKQLWVATEKGLVVLDENEKEIYRYSKNIDKVAFFESTKDTVVASTSDGMHIFSIKNGIISYAGHNPTYLIITSGFDSQGLRWLGGRNYLYRLNKDQPLHRINEENIIQNIPAKSILPFSGKIIVSVEGGLAVYDENGKFQEKIPFMERLKPGRPYGLQHDELGRIWMSSDKGMICFEPNPLRWYVFDITDNLQSIEFSSPAYHKAQDGTMYYGGIEGINGFHPSRFNSRQQVSPPFITRLFHNDTLFCQGIPPANLHLQTDWTDNRIAGRVTTADYGRHLRTKYTFLLKGYDNDWCAPSERAEFSYEKIPAGKYELWAKAIDGYGNESRSVILLHINIPPPFWQNIWFIVLASCLGIGILVYVIRSIQRWRYQKIIRELEQKDALNQERLRIARDLHDDIGAELSRIAILTRSSSTPEQEKLERISQKTLTLIENLRHIIWSTDPRNDKVDDLQAILREYVSGFAEKNDWYYQIEEEGDGSMQTLSAMAKRNIFLILKECLNNTWKHADANSIYLQWKCTPDLLEITYCDNGRGISGTNGNGYGLSNMRERAKTLGGTLSINNQESGGVKIVLNLPFEQKK